MPRHGGAGSAEDQTTPRAEIPGSTGITGSNLHRLAGARLTLGCPLGCS